MRLDGCVFYNGKDSEEYALAHVTKGFIRIDRKQNYRKKSQSKIDKNLGKEMLIR